MSSNIIFNKTNIVDSVGNNKLSYNFPKAVTFKKGDTISVSHLNMYFSWFNISKLYNNIFFQYKWWDLDGDLTVIVDVLIPDGFYSVGTLYEFLQSVMVQNGHFLKTLEGNKYLYFIEIIPNSTYYSIEIRLSACAKNMDFGQGIVPLVDFCTPPTTWTAPTNFETAEVIIPGNNYFGDLLGYNKPSNIFQDLTIQPPINLKYSFLNDVTPNMLPSSSYIITCSLVDNDMSIPNNVLYSFTLDSSTKFGQTISPGSDIIWAKIREGTYSSIFIEIYDQDFKRLMIVDPNLLITLSINQK